MKKKTVWRCWLLLALGVLGGCENFPPTEAEAAPSDEAFMDLKETVRGQAFPALEHLLVYRQRVCAMPAERREQFSRSYPSDGDSTGVKAELMLASCDPGGDLERLHRALSQARDLEKTSPGFEALLELMAAQTDAHRQLQRRLEDQQARMEELVEGIRQIEMEMGQ